MKAVALGKDKNGRVAFRYSVELVDGKIVSASGFSAPESGTPAFDAVFRRSRPRVVETLEIVPQEEPKT